MAEAIKYEIQYQGRKFSVRTELFEIRGVVRSNVTVFGAGVAFEEAALADGIDVGEIMRQLHKDTLSRLVGGQYDRKIAMVTTSDSAPTVEEHDALVFPMKPAGPETWES